MNQPLSETTSQGGAPTLDDRIFRVRPSRLSGTVHVSGAKNSVLRLMAASLLSSEPIELANYPAGLLDAQVHASMLERLGKRCTLSDGTLTIEEIATPPSSLDWDGRSIRNTLLILGSLTARTGAGSVPLPGGCRLGERKYDLHVMLLEAMGAEVREEGDQLVAEAAGGLTGAEIHLPIRSTGATENALLCGSLARGTTRIWNPHVRPEILDLIRMLRAMGARIRVFGQEHIEVEGVDALRGARHEVLADNMEAITWLIASVITGGDVEIVGFPHDDLEIPLIHLRESGAEFYRGRDRLIVRGGRCYPVEIATGPYPAINSDMQPLFAVYGVAAHGESRIIDLRFPGRYGYAEELKRMGARFETSGNLLRILGGHPLDGARVRALDLRAGVALVLAGLMATGETEVTDAWQVERGYDGFLDKLAGLGGDVSDV